eukprot:371168-Rhodomonas_salina.2
MMQRLSAAAIRCAAGRACRNREGYSESAFLTTAILCLAYAEHRERTFSWPRDSEARDHDTPEYKGSVSMW